MLFQKTYVHHNWNATVLCFSACLTFILVSVIAVNLCSASITQFNETHQGSNSYSSKVNDTESRLDVALSPLVQTIKDDVLFKRYDDKQLMIVDRNRRQISNTKIAHLLVKLLSKPKNVSHLLIDLRGTGKSPTFKKWFTKKNANTIKSFIIPIGPFKPERIEVGQNVEKTSDELLQVVNRLTNKVDALEKAVKNDGQYRVKSASLTGDLVNSVNQLQTRIANRKRVLMSNSILDPPIKQTANKDVTTVLAGQSASLYCQIDTNEPVKEFFWTKPDGSKIDGSGRYRVDKNMLVVHHTVITDQGPYRCVAERVNGRMDTAAATLIVSVCSDGNTCENNGKCVEEPSEEEIQNIDAKGTYRRAVVEKYTATRCKCPVGFFGTRCQNTEKTQAGLTYSILFFVCLILVCVLGSCCCLMFRNTHGFHEENPFAKIFGVSKGWNGSRPLYTEVHLDDHDRHGVGGHHGSDEYFLEDDVTILDAFGRRQPSRASSHHSHPDVTLRSYQLGETTNGPRIYGQTEFHDTRAAGHVAPRPAGHVAPRPGESKLSGATSSMGQSDRDSHWSTNSHVSEGFRQSSGATSFADDHRSVPSHQSHSSLALPVNKYHPHSTPNKSSPPGHSRKNSDGENKMSSLPSHHTASVTSVHPSRRPSVHSGGSGSSKSAASHARRVSEKLSPHQESVGNDAARSCPSKVAASTSNHSRKSAMCSKDKLNFDSEPDTEPLYTVRSGDLLPDPRTVRRQRLSCGTSLTPYRSVNSISYSSYHNRCTSSLPNRSRSSPCDGLQFSSVWGRALREPRPRCFSCGCSPQYDFGQMSIAYRGRFPSSTGRDSWCFPPNRSQNSSPGLKCLSGCNNAGKKPKKRKFKKMKKHKCSQCSKTTRPKTLKTKRSSKRGSSQSSFASSNMDEDNQQGSQSNQSIALSELGENKSKRSKRSPAPSVTTEHDRPAAILKLESSDGSEQSSEESQSDSSAGSSSRGSSEIRTTPKKSVSYSSIVIEHPSRGPSPRLGTVTAHSFVSGKDSVTRGLLRSPRNNAKSSKKKPLNISANQGSTPAKNVAKLVDKDTSSRTKSTDGKKIQANRNPAKPSGTPTKNLANVTGSGPTSKTKSSKAKPTDGKEAQANKNLTKPSGTPTKNLAKITDGGTASKTKTTDGKEAQVKTAQSKPTSTKNVEKGTDRGTASKTASIDNKVKNSSKQTSPQSIITNGPKIRTSKTNLKRTSVCSGESSRPGSAATSDGASSFASCRRNTNKNSTSASSGTSIAKTKYRNRNRVACSTSKSSMSRKSSKYTTGSSMSCTSSMSGASSRSERSRRKSCVKRSSGKKSSGKAGKGSYRENDKLARCFANFAEAVHMRNFRPGSQNGAPLPVPRRMASPPLFSAVPRERFSVTRPGGAWGGGFVRNPVSCGGNTRLSLECAQVPIHQQYAASRISPHHDWKAPTGIPRSGRPSFAAQRLSMRAVDSRRHNTADNVHVGFDEREKRHRGFATVNKFESSTSEALRRLASQEHHQTVTTTTTAHHHTHHHHSDHHSPSPVPQTSILDTPFSVQFGWTDHKEHHHQPRADHNSRSTPHHGEAAAAHVPVEHRSTGASPHHATGETQASIDSLDVPLKVEFSWSGRNVSSNSGKDPGRVVETFPQPLRYQQFDNVARSHGAASSAEGLADRRSAGPRPPSVTQQRSPFAESLRRQQELQRGKEKETDVWTSEHVQGIRDEFKRLSPVVDQFVAF